MVYVLVFLLGCSIAIGLFELLYLEFIIEFNTLTTPYYQLGITFYSEEDETDSSITIQKLCVGLFFINLNLVFYKKNI